MEVWRKKALPEIEKTLRQKAQAQAIAKKVGVPCNGKELLQVQTAQGAFSFFNPRFLCPQTGSSAFLSAAQDFQSGVSEGREALALSLCLAPSSYEKACGVRHRSAGGAAATRQTLRDGGEKTAKRRDRQIKAAGAAGLASPPPAFASAELYAPTPGEYPVFEDGLLVKAQNPFHRKAGAPPAKTSQFHNAYFGLAPPPLGTRHFVMGSSDGEISLRLALRAFMRPQWQGSAVPISLVAITDAERGLRSAMEQAFGAGVCLFLDWFHLRKKGCELASMRVGTKEALAALKQPLLRSLFRGTVAEALDVLIALPVRNAVMRTKLQTYLANRRGEIIDYERRARLGHCIGRGRMEKGVAIAVGQRQRDNGIRWSRKGSYALGMVTAYQADGNAGKL